MNYKEALEYNKKFLDGLGDLREFFKVDLDINDLMIKLESIYAEEAEEDFVLRGELFAFMDRDDFIQYLEERYHVHWCEWMVTYRGIISWE